MNHIQIFTRQSELVKSTIFDQNCIFWQDITILLIKYIPNKALNQITLEEGGTTSVTRVLKPMLKQRNKGEKGRINK